MSLTQDVAFCVLLFLSCQKTKEKMEEGKGVGRERERGKKKDQAKVSFHREHNIRLYSLKQGEQKMRNQSAELQMKIHLSKAEDTLSQTLSLFLL